jgi:ubiquinone/menaquinone biosynthesis C-methylase UbiE
MAQDKARQRGLDARFVVGDALDLPAVGETYDTVIDSAVFHVFGDENRATYVHGLHQVLRPGGRYYMLCFSEKVPGTVGPRRVSEPEIRASFAQGWTVDSVTPVEMETTDVMVSAYLAAITRT